MTPGLGLAESVVSLAFVEHFRCPDEYAEFEVLEPMSAECGFYRLGPDIVCFGRSAAGSRAKRATDPLYDAMQDITWNRHAVRLPFSPCDVIDGIRDERYAGCTSRVPAIVNEAYYFLRPLLTVAVRKHLQWLLLRNWRRTPFPQWPVDTTVERILEMLMMLSLRRHGIDKIPFIWFWPDDSQSCIVMTHDVETAIGKEYVPHLLDLDETYGVRASFQVVPEGGYTVEDSFLQTIRMRGFEVGVHDLNHDGRLFESRAEFQRRLVRINQYGRQFQAEGFRSAVLYRRLDWLQGLEFSYDMSVPNLGHLEAQRGGCCSVMPFFNGRVLEIPVTTTQDYSLFHILKEHSIDLWKTQLDIIARRHGLASFIVHPDYIRDTRPRRTYESLLAYVTALCSRSRAWLALPSEVSRWWKQRSRMSLVRDRERWKVVGQGSKRARVAYAMLEEGKVVYKLQEPIRTMSGVFGARG
jgi:hypothetical protein